MAKIIRDRSAGTGDTGTVKTVDPLKTATTKGKKKQAKYSKKKLPGKRTKGGSTRGRARGKTSTESVEQLLKAKSLVDQLGGIETARKALDALAKLLD